MRPQCSGPRCTSEADSAVSVLAPTGEVIDGVPVLAPVLSGFLCIPCGAGWSAPFVAALGGHVDVEQLIDSDPRFVAKVGPFNVRMMPGQEPYTAAELAFVNALIGDAALGDPGEYGEVIGLVDVRP